MKTDSQKNSLKKKQKPLKNYLQFSGLAFQLLAAVLVGYWIGHWLDEKTGTSKPWYTVGLMAVFIVATMVRVIRELTNE
ncbi:MAG: AtpZ/AtpI family protein [Cyclobacteriaceae bacterium]|nr:AtpZ/AtpI family protein [Cyclobacteriaceae bacterium]